MTSVDFIKWLASLWLNFLCFLNVVVVEEEEDILISFKDCSKPVQTGANTVANASGHIILISTWC